VARGLDNPAVHLPLALIGGSAALATGARLYGHDLDDQTLISGSVAAAALILIVVPLLSSLGRPRIPSFLRQAAARLGATKLWPSGRSVRWAPIAAVLLIGAIAGFATWIAGFSAAVPGAVRSALLQSGSTLEGRATALSGDRLRLSGTIVALAGIEAPEREQRCARPSVQQWRCGAAAREALARIVRGRRVVCDVTPGEGGREATGTCTINGTDIAAELVSGGHVFAKSGLLARYGSEEASARSAKAGLWAGEADRPSDYRAKRWAEAKLASPEGCPIKGRITSGNRVYVLPWSQSYDRIRVRSSRGERWFCSEADAQAAGFRPTEPS
jgi:endonuclease YncB( thermonuclease family)